MNPDRLAELEDERRFLLRSLRDLDAEHAAGDVDDIDYATLRDGYTARAADVLRAIDEGKAALPAPPGAAVAPAGLAVVAVVAVAGGVGWLVARSSGERLPGRRSPAAGPPRRSQRCWPGPDAVGHRPASAIELYDDVLARRPEHAEALTYSGWLLVTASTGASDEVRVGGGRCRSRPARPGRRRRRATTPTRTASSP